MSKWERLYDHPWVALLEILAPYNHIKEYRVYTKLRYGPSDISPVNMYSLRAPRRQRETVIIPGTYLYKTFDIAVRRMLQQSLQAEALLVINDIDSKIEFPHTILKNTSAEFHHWTYRLLYLSLLTVLFGKIIYTCCSSQKPMPRIKWNFTAERVFNLSFETTEKNVKLNFHDVSLLMSSVDFRGNTARSRNVPISELPMKISEVANDIWEELM